MEQINESFAHWRELPGISMLYHAAEVSPGRSETQRHLAPRVSFLIRGSITEIDDMAHQVETGPMSLNYCPPGMSHAHWIRSNRLVCLCADLDPEFIRESGCEKILDAPAIFTSGPVTATMLRIRKEMLSQDTASELILRGLFIQLLGEMSRSSEPSRLSAEPPPWLRRACSLLRERCLENVSIEEISKEVGVHPSHLARVFRTFLNDTPGEILRKHRIAWAAKEVARSPRSLRSIASDAGFSDQAHFTRQFKQQVGVSPTEFRRSVRL